MQEKKIIVALGCLDKILNLIERVYPPKKLCHYLLTFMSFKACMTFFLSYVDKKENIYFFKYKKSDIFFQIFSYDPQKKESHKGLE